MKDFLGKDYQLGYNYWELPRHVVDGCVNYDECPMCYMCKAYDTSSAKCLNCRVGSCDKEKHTSHWVSKIMYQHPPLEVC